MWEEGLMGDFLALLFSALITQTRILEAFSAGFYYVNRYMFYCSSKARQRCYGHHLRFMLWKNNEKVVHHRAFT